MSFIFLSFTKEAAVACMLPQLTYACDLGGKFVGLAPITLTTLTTRKALKLAVKSLLSLPACVMTAIYI